MKKEITFTAKQVGERVKKRRTELNLTMPELGGRVGANKSTIQRYEADNDYEWTGRSALDYSRMADGDSHTGSLGRWNIPNRQEQIFKSL